MGVYTFNCPECRSRFDSESSVQWSVDQTATVACQVGKRPKCTVYCTGEVITTPQSPVPPGPSATPTISLDDAPANSQRMAYLEVQTIDGGISRLLIGEGLIQTYGRKSDFDVCDHPVDTEDRKMSRVHFQIESRMHNRQPSYIISDMGSVHGTRVVRQVGGNNTNTIQLYVNKDNKEDHDGVCLEQNDLVVAGNTFMRFGIDLLAAPVITPDASAPDKFDPNRTTVF